MAGEDLGIWFVGAWGGVATTSAVGLAALQHKLTEETALVSALKEFAPLELADWPRFTVGGHEIRETSYRSEAEHLYRQSGVFTSEMLEGTAERLAAWDANIRPGTTLNVGERIASFGGPWLQDFANETASEAVARLQKDIEEFRTANNLKHVVVVNVSSTEPPATDDIRAMNWTQLEKALADGSGTAVPASVIYGVAAMQAGCSFVNFTPSIGSDCPAMEELALQCSVPHVGRDGKTGETLMKAVLAPMFAARNLNVMSWVGHNIFGNLDGKVLDDPVNKANKVKSKDHLLTEILGYPPKTLVSIEYIESMADWKTAWDHIHFQGFLGTKMVLQFIWQGCDSLLAAPLVLDLVRLTERQWRAGRSGVMGHLASFFKSPQGANDPEFAMQFLELRKWAAEIADADTPNS